VWNPAGRAKSYLTQASMQRMGPGGAASGGGATPAPVAVTGWWCCSAVAPSAGLPPIWLAPWKKAWALIPEHTHPVLVSPAKPYGPAAPPPRVPCGRAGARVFALVRVLDGSGQRWTWCGGSAEVVRARGPGQANLPHTRSVVEALAEAIGSG